MMIILENARLRAEFNPTNGAQQSVTSYTVSPEGDGVTFVWDRLTSQYGGEHTIGFLDSQIHRATCPGDIRRRNCLPDFPEYSEFATMIERSIP